MSTAATPLLRCKNWKLCGGDATDAPKRGPYSHMCSDCRKQRGQELGAIRREVNIERSGEAKSLDDAMAKLRAAARRLEKAVAADRAVRTERQQAIGGFNAAIKEVNAQAQRVLNAPTMSSARVHERMERELHEIEQAQGP